ncbi:MFS transporter [Flavobacterium sp. NRK1]|uniref:MFS transporter n=1 Tax=Flavobacterium sp. NRK1 TaxID=2954929 RepID=UPI0020921B3F|nr:MFS transporter [Flavobacterium sp. NRK1]MCO6149201.1 MFS transporter [Flavobacterium sp. NRK1]
MKKLSSIQILIMAITAGVCVANIYYCQPILNEIARSLNLNGDDVGIIAPLSQAGYGLGLLFITPLGDKIDRKRLILYLQLLLIAALIGMSFSTSLLSLYAASLAIGLFAVTAQVILPMAASLVTENRGKVVGIIFTGILIGILTARVFSGFITEWIGWKYVYLISAAIVGVTAILMQTDFPSVEDRFEGSYLKLLSSVIHQLKRFRTLRLSALLGALVFGALSSFWVTLTFYLSGAPFNYKPDIIGLYGLLAAGGALMAPLIGKISDKGESPKKVLLLALTLIVVSIILLYLFPASNIALILTVLLIDVGVQAVQTTNIALIYTLDTKANSRINTVYMTSFFIGGSLGAFAGIIAWKHGGWNVVLLQMIIFIVLAVITTLNINNNQNK